MDSYRGYTITQHFGGYTVLFQGDEVYFATVTEARLFIDEIIDGQ